ncbi:hypothetical protein PV08_06500 [Exophiala spinifera]|uniref:FAD-binding domain-containing protein n=1 Tax=Exophiala spinifera TaxID=91928 RepID=A0A0D1ZUL8_9EURO|nr:uncharacterized protein PV08_06500 [Exophiala spinifera]KIW16447.1 hypothetical protein PV08_06500 [Exophiala spinifera]
MTAPILIVGAGLGGLSLAQSLKKDGIAFKIFERDSTASYRAQGYRIRISQHMLKKLLPQDVFATLEKACPDVVPGGRRIDAITGETHEGAGGPNLKDQHSWNADRTLMRTILMTGLEEHIEFDKKLERYELAGEGVTAYFTDGTSASGRLLIGADGVRSSVRKQLVPDQVILDTQVRAVFGKTPIRDGPLVPADVDKGITVISEPPPTAAVKLFCDGMRFDRDVDIAVKLPEDYIYWVLLFPKTRVSISDQDLLSLDGEKSVQLAQHLTCDWRRSNRAIIDHADTSACAALAFEMAAPEHLGWTPNAKVTLLGDAAHPMVPVGALGANAAFEDAVCLAAVLRGPVNEEALSTYEKDVTTRARAAIEQVLGPGRGLLGMKPIEELKPSSLWTWR